MNDNGEFSDVDRGLLERALTLARRAAANGSRPYAAVLAEGEEVLFERCNTVRETRDPTRHAELTLISAAAPLVGQETLARSTLYASTEPCEMCSGAMVRAGLARVVFACSEAMAAEVAGRPVTWNAADVLAGMGATLTLVGPALPEAGRAVHEVARAHSAADE